MGITRVADPTQIFLLPYGYPASELHINILLFERHLWITALFASK